MKDKIFECIVGSVAYNTNLPTSDIDIKGVYCQSHPDILGLKYQEQRNIDKDTTFYEIRRFIDLAGSANPTILEMLFSDESMIKYLHPCFQPVIDARFSFLTTICSKSFGGFAVAQIKKAKGLDKKMNWEKERVERKDVLDFCTVFDYGKGVPFKQWIDLPHSPFQQEYIGLSKVNNMPNCYAIYHDSAGQYDGIPTLGYKGVVGEDSNDVRLSSIPKGEYCFGMMYFNKDAYSIHCKEYREYQEWLENRNESRYVDTQVHGQLVDGKNLLHCVRLIDCAIEIAETGNLTVLRPNREELLKIRRGECDLNQIIEECEEKIAKMDELFANSDLPTSVSTDFKHELILKVRQLCNS